jgi:YYY domain-containing protein
MPLALLALAFAASFVLARGSWRSFSAMAISFLMGGLAIGALKPTNTWDYYPYLALAIVAVIYTQAMYYQPDKNSLSRLPLIADLPPLAKKALVILFQILLLLGFSTLLYYPFEQWYGLGYSKIDFWQGGRTPISSYLTHWGLFLFVIVSWMIWETREWMANTPISALRKLTPYRALIIALLAGLMLTILLLSVRLPGEWKIPIGKNVIVALLVLPLAAWAGILILRPGQPDAKRFVLFLIGTGLTITLMVELIVLVGDIGRMNTVFKFYLQVWTLFAVSAAASLGWLLSALRDWNPGWRRAWSAVFVLLVAAAALYPLTASRAKILDRFSTGLPNGLDGMEYMQNSVYDWEGVMDLNQDYRAIRWMQENVQGTPVIVEANLRDLYRWGSRFSIYTGLPGVVGWEWHQQQQRALTPGSWISERIAEIDQFYTTISLQEALAFLRKYGVKYIIVGQLERNHYPGPGLDKFEAQDGILWHEVFRDQDTVIYEVNDDPTNSG